MKFLSRYSAIMGAAFLMATSAIGPGFLTQTTVFTVQLGASFGFAILVSIIADVIIQVNIWSIIAATNRRAQDIGNALYKGVGDFLAWLIIIGGVVFNVGNLAGCGLGLQVLWGIDPIVGAALSTCVAIFIFMNRNMGKAIDLLSQGLGALMILLIAYIAWVTNPPWSSALLYTFLPEKISMMAMLTIVGGTVGGYITFSGAHRLLEAGVHGVARLPEVRRSATIAIGVASLMRVLLFLASLGVVMQGLPIDAQNPPASVFRGASGELGYKIFGMVIWAAAITSVVGTSFTCISFAQSFHRVVLAQKKYFTVGFILLAMVLLAIFGKPVKVLIFAGAFNGLILAFSLAIMLLATTQPTLMNGYRHPKIYTALGAILAVLIAVLGTMAVWQSWNF